TAQPAEVIPIVDLVIEVGHPLLTLAEPDVAAVPVAAGIDDVPDGPAVDAFHRLQVAGLVAALRAGANAGLLRPRLLFGLQDPADAGAVDADGLLGEDVLASGHRGGDVDGAETGRGRQDDVVDAFRADHFFVGVQADVAALLGQVDLVTQLLDAGVVVERQ